MPKEITVKIRVPTGEELEKSITDMLVKVVPELAMKVEVVEEEKPSEEAPKPEEEPKE